ncbi:reverse transcriptase [Penicillium griseofulvum]|uniref:Reverse transcriptase n=1 Tax=Penicillium patulum TaxID=5078 RepID=A0A135LRL7_PENPA|nr:reverse transcriptase [Penicillium griseofulvum]KXG51628.1 reverse transcriptase [Penicillium griseofulvum]
MFEFTVMPFGVTNRPGTFQRYIDEAMQPHEAYTSWYIDNILVFANTEEQHDQRVAAIKETLDEFQIKINYKKAVYKAQSIKFLGIIIHPDRVEADPDTVAIKD